MKNKLTTAKSTSKKPVPVKIVSDSPPATGVDKKWMAEDDLRTLSRAAEIKSDKSRLSAVKSVAKEQLKNLGKILK